MNEQTQQPNGAPRIACRLELLPGDGVVVKVSHAKDFGFDAVALPGRYLDDYRAELSAVAGHLPLPVSAISLGFRGSLVSSDPGRRDACRDSLLSLFDLCAEVGIAFVNMPPSLAQDNGTRLADVAERDALLVDQLPLLAAEAEARGVRLLLEPVNRYESDYLNTLAHAAALCEKAGHANLGVTADLFHMQMEEQNTPEAIRAAGKWIRYVHVAENTRQEPGSGSMNFAAAFAALRETGYDGFLEVESRSLSGPPEACLPRAAALLREAWKRTG